MTLLVTPQQANLLDLGQNKGMLHLALRNRQDDGGHPDQDRRPRTTGAAAAAQGPGAASQGLAHPARHQGAGPPGPAFAAGAGRGASCEREVPRHPRAAEGLAHPARYPGIGGLASYLTLAERAGRGASGASKAQASSPQDPVLDGSRD